jgi:hypothetical protein
LISVLSVVDSYLISDKFLLKFIWRVCLRINHKFIFLFIFQRGLYRLLNFCVVLTASVYILLLFDLDDVLAYFKAEIWVEFVFKY